MRIKLISSVLMLAFTASVSIGQNHGADTLFFASGDVVVAFVKEITPTDVKYVDASNPDGPLFVLPKTKLSSITYSNGSKEQYAIPQQVASVNHSQSYDSYQGRSFEDPEAREFTFADRKNSSTPVVYYGIDFTMSKFIGSSGFNDPAHIVDVYLDNINQKIIIERERYDFGILLGRRFYDIDLDMLSGRNRSINPYEVVTNSNHTISSDQIGQLVASYNPQAQEGVGLVIVMESLDKLREEGVMHFTFFDIKSKKVLHIRKETGKASGFGIRNYWMNPVREALEKLKRSY
ncbi:MAG: hypothetical protein K9J06_10845 [Flavobacteriales bacterium]|nr:hypothetical protein [Flavobacteriales bacterium]